MHTRHVTHPPTPRGWRIGTVLMWLVLACLLPGMVGTAALFWTQYRDGRTALEQDMVTTARALTRSVDAQLFTARAIAQTLAASDALAAGDLPRFYQRAKEVLNSTGVGMNVVLSDASGQQVLNTLRALGGPLPRHGNPELLRQVFASGQAQISNVYLGGVLTRPVISVDVPVQSRGQTVLVLSMGLRLDDLGSILTAQRFPNDWLAAIFDGEGTIAARTLAPEQHVGQKGTAEFVARILQSPEGVMQTQSREGVPTLSAWSRSPVTGWSVAIGVSRAALEQALSQRLRLLGAGMFALLLTGLLLAWLAARKIDGSLQALNQQAVALREGEALPAPTLDIVETAEVSGVIEDTARQLRARAHELSEVYRIAGFGVWRYELPSRRLTVSDSVRDMLGREVPAQPEQRKHLMSAEARAQLQQAIENILPQGADCDLELPVLHADGHTVWLHQKGEAVRDDQGKVMELRGSVLDITRRKQAEAALEDNRQQYVRELEREVATRTASLTRANEELERRNRTDTLTGLQNRRSAIERLRHEFLRLKRTGSSYASLFIDIDHFKRINDNFGHETGDEVLRQLAAVLTEAVRATDFIGRYGGEEFLVLLADTDAPGAALRAEAIRQAVASHDFGVVRQLTVSIGVALARAEDKNEEEAVNRADQALYRAKAEGRDRVCVA